ncbi:hypothetical protein DF182_02065 [Chitinophaga flava]|uniref:Uncharacterized protein n=1 Tax=Chitinophaga flava TaxID=2259036 RepID=A0A365XYG7_9BACT|nr:hypothetical protein DF182_02065 [Chitinophaga flava]
MIKVLALVFAQLILRSLDGGITLMAISCSPNRRSAAPHRHSPLAAGAVARAQALERSGRAQRGRAPAGRAFVLYLAGSASGRQNQKWKARGDGGGRTKWTAKGWRA